MKTPARRCIAAVGALLFAVALARAQISPAEHAKHHPGGGTPGGTSGETAKVSAGGMMSSMMDMMGEMMQGAAPQTKETYPALMALPDLPLEKRGEILAQARARMAAATSQMNLAADAMLAAEGFDDLARMQGAISQMRESLTQLDSAVAARRALAEGRAPRDVALAWFKREMNLLPPVSPHAAHSWFGITPFHFSAMAALIAFAAVMVAMYFFKMRRASVLLTRLAADGPAVAAPVTTPVASPSAAPPAQRWTGQLRVARIFDETPDVKTFRLVSPDGGAMPFIHEPGQFLTLTITLDGKRTSRSYTIASSPSHRNYCEITVKREDHHGVSSHLHASLHEGAMLDVTAPAGRFTFTGREADSIVLIAGGVGITPMMSVVRYLTDIGWKDEILLLACFRTPQDYIFREELERLQGRHPNLHVIVSVTRATDGWPGRTGRIDKDALQSLVPDISKRRIHICGPVPMMDAVKTALRQLGTPDASIHTESFGPAGKAADAPTASSSATATVTFRKSQRTVPLTPGGTILDAADSAGIAIDNSCRSGTCGTCKVKLLSGKVTMECEDALSDEDRKAGMILACQAKATSPVTVEA